MSDIQPIETEYNGYRFRSRLEARWAVFFDEVGIEYEYEPEGFELDDGTRYLPDFYFPRYDWYGEVKAPREGAAEEILRAKRFVGDKIKVLVLFGNIPPKADCPFWHYAALQYSYICREVYANRCMLVAHTSAMTGDTESAFLGNCYVDRRFSVILSANHPNLILQLLEPANDNDLYPSGAQRISDLFGLVSWDVLSEAYDKARYARFEWGEAG